MDNMCDQKSYTPWGWSNIYQLTHLMQRFQMLILTISLLKYRFRAFPYLSSFKCPYIQIVFQALSNIDGHCCSSQVMDGLTYKFQFVLLKHHKILQLFSWTDNLWHFITAESGIVARPDVRSIPWSNYPGSPVFSILAGTI